MPVSELCTTALPEVVDALVLSRTTVPVPVLCITALPVEVIAAVSTLAVGATVSPVTVKLLVASLVWPARSVSLTLN